MCSTTWPPAHDQYRFYIIALQCSEEYTFTNQQFLARLGDNYGAEAAAEVAPYLG